MSKKRKNWMMTIWGEAFPHCIKDLDKLIICHIQKEITRNGKVHWQAFCQFTDKVTMPYLRDFFLDRGFAAHIGCKDKEDEKKIKTALQGVQYVWGYGPLALKKLLDPNERYIIRDKQVIHTPVDEEHMDLYHRLSADTKAAVVMRNNEELNVKIFETILKENENSRFYISEMGTREKMKKYIKEFK